MDKEHRLRLQRLWLKLLENISDYKGIIGGLYAEGIFTPALKERVEQKTGTDQLREILDILPKRGNTAFDVFYQVLVDREEYTAADLLCPEKAAERQSKSSTGSVISGAQESGKDLLPEEDELPSKWPDQNSHDPFRVAVKIVTEENRGMKALFDRAVTGAGPVYGMHKATRGIFLLIGNEHFKGARASGVDLADRDGTGKDTIALTNLFRQLSFRVVTKVNLNAKEMVEAVLEQSAAVDPTDNCFACAVLTHGERDKVYGVDGEMASLDKLKAAVAENCQMLIGKPKIFFIQACQGKKVDSGKVVTGGEGDAGSNPAKASEIDNFQELAENFAGIQLREKTLSDAASEGRVSSKSDIFVAMATVPDFVSWRNTNWGTWFVQAVVYIFSNFAYKYEINQLMTRVNKLVSRAETAKGFKQVSIYSSSLTSEFYFFPGLHQGVVESHSEVDFDKRDVPSQKSVPLQTASLAPGRLTAPSQPASESGSVTAQASDGVDGGKSVLVE